MKDRFNLYHRFLKFKGIYRLALNSFIRLVIIVAIIAVILILAQLFINDLNSKIEFFLTEWKAPMTLTVFLISETILGLIPPDFFIAWAGKTSQPLLMLSVLAILSYIGGVIAFYIGAWLRRFQKVSDWLEKKFAPHFDKIKKYGGFLIVFSALFPLPFSTISLVAGLVNYPQKSFLLLGLSRLLRFYLYALILFNVI